MKNEKGQYIFGVCKVNEKGQIVIPKEARDVFKISGGDNLIMLGDEKQGIALIKAEIFGDVAKEMLSKTKGEQK